MKPPYLVGIDSGTQSVRVMIFDSQGTLVSQGSAVHAPLVFPGNEMVEQDPQDLWNKFCQACHKAMNKLSKVDRKKIAACSLTAQRSSIIAVDSQGGDPLRPVINWMDKRRVNIESCQFPPPFDEISKSSKANWMRVNEPDLFNAAHKFLSVSGWLTKKLCGDFKDCTGSVAGVWPFDISKLSWSEDPLLYEAMALIPQRLPELFSPGEVMGVITKTASQETGLMEGLPIIASSGDKMCEMLGAGAVQTNQGYITYGTMAGLMMNTDRVVMAPNAQYWTNPSAVPGKWCLEYAMERGYFMLAWFGQQFGSTMETPADMLPSLDMEAEEVPPGSEGLVFAPFMTKVGAAHDDRSVMVGLGSGHRRGHIYRALLEGIAYTLRSGRELMERDASAQIDELMVGGGGARSDLVMQITADVFGIPCGRVQTTETCALGAAIEAAVGAGVFPSYQDAISQMIHRTEQFLPIPENTHLYAEIYGEIFKRIHLSLVEIFQSYEDLFG